MQVCHECGGRFNTEKEMLDHFSKTPLKSHKSSFGKLEILLKLYLQLNNFRDPLPSSVRATHEIIPKWTLAWNYANKKIMVSDWSETIDQLPKGYQGTGKVIFF